MTQLQVDWATSATTDLYEMSPALCAIKFRKKIASNSTQMGDVPHLLAPFIVLRFVAEGSELEQPWYVSRKIIKRINL